MPLPATAAARASSNPAEQRPQHVQASGPWAHRSGLAGGRWRTDIRRSQRGGRVEHLGFRQASQVLGEQLLERAVEPAGEFV